MAIAVSAKEFPFYKAQVPLFPLAQHSSDLIANSFANTCPATGYPFCSSGISYNGQTLQGTASTVVFNFSPYGFAQNCSTSATMSGPDVLETAADTAECFERNTSVLLESENAQPSSVYCINAVHVGATGGGTTSDCLITPGPKVLSVNYELIHTDDLPIDANPNAGGGLRIFPDKKTPNETVDRRRIRVKAQYSQMTAGIRIYFRNFDVDDPSADTAPIDANDTPTLKTGNDNNGNVDGTSATRAGVLHVPPSGQPNPYNCQAFSNANASGVSCETDSNGVAVVEYTLTMQPGDNFAIVASPDEAYVSSLLHTTDGINLKDATNIEIPVTTTTDNACASNDGNKACRSDMLSVWRRLHIEVDSMGNVGTINRITGTVDGPVTIPRSTGLMPGAAAVNLTITNPLNVQAFSFGRFLTASNDLLVNSNTTNAVELLNTTSRAITIADGTSFILYDDDDFNSDDSPIFSTGTYLPYEVDGDEKEALVNGPFTVLPQSFDHLRPEDGVYPDGRPRNLYASAYVKPEYEWAQSVVNYNQINIQFTLNVPESNLPALINANRNSINDEKDDFWIVYFIVGYQGEEHEDADGETRANPGISSATGPGVVLCDCFSSNTCVGTSCSSVIPKGAFGSLIYLEVMQDVTRTYFLQLGSLLLNQGTTVPHELGHQFGLKGDNKNSISGEPDRPLATYRIMDYPNRGQGQTDDYFLHEEHINLIRRRIKSPGA